MCGMACTQKCAIPWTWRKWYFPRKTDPMQKASRMQTTPNMDKYLIWNFSLVYISSTSITSPHSVKNSLGYIAETVRMMLPLYKCESENTKYLIHVKLANNRAYFILIIIQCHPFQRLLISSSKSDLIMKLGNAVVMSLQWMKLYRQSALKL